MRDTNGCLMKWIDCNDLGPEVKIRMGEMLLVQNYGKDETDMSTINARDERVKM